MTSIQRLDCHAPTPARRAVVATSSDGEQPVRLSKEQQQAYQADEHADLARQCIHYPAGGTTERTLSVLQFLVVVWALKAGEGQCNGLHKDLTL